jgi:tripartite-type tricarboxylate transporter receptor subunit TctC
MFSLARPITALLLLALPALVSAQGFPKGPVKLIVPFPPGGGSDVVARAIAPKMAEALGQPVIIENRAGASGNIGTELVAKAPADGQTLLMASAATAIQTTLAKNLAWDLARDFAPVSLLVINQSVLVAHPSVRATSVKELLAFAKANPGKLSFASYGNGTSAHLAGELFKLLGGVDLLHVPYKGAAPATSDVLGGQVDLLFADVAAVLPHIKAGRLKALGIGSSKRFEGLPEVPTIAEAGLAGYEGGGWLGLVVPAATPREAIAALNAAVSKSLASPEVKERLVALATIPVGNTPAYFGDFMHGEVVKWARVIRAAHVTGD